MKVLLLGATGRTGELILEELLQRGHTVCALVRDENKMKVTSSALTVFEDSTLDEQTLNAAMQGCEAIISALNISRYRDFPWSALRTPKDFLSATIKKVISAASQHQIKRVIVISAWGVNETRAHIPWWFKWIIDHSNIRFAYQDHELQEQLLKKSDLNWTAIRPAGLTNSSSFRPVKVSINNSPKPSLLIGRKSVAKFTVNVLEQGIYIRQAPVISN
ncbi:NAD(P)-dependent oxidoreductase [Mucilaginibacter sp.]|jgi:putative NADH-flavin reductase|uniref:NAD(P)-dependent oxidoreductase n=1 Tax=Mucilaginibacter sp. TaxID=1882438 RepID=UPI0035627331